MEEDGIKNIGNGRRSMDVRWVSILSGYRMVGMEYLQEPVTPPSVDNVYPRFLIQGSLMMQSPQPENPFA